MLAKRIALTAALIVCSTLGCKEGSPATGGISPVEAAFVSEDRPTNVTSRYVSLRERSVDGGRIVLDVILTDIDEPITGIALKLNYPDSFSKFIECTAGDLFPSGQCFFAEPSSGSGEVFIGRSVSAQNQATTVSGDKVIVRVEFLAFGESSGPIVIEGQNLGGGDASAVLDVNGDPILMQWFSGTLQGT